MIMYYFIEPEGNNQDKKLLRGLERKVYKYILSHNPCTLSDLKKKFPYYDVELAVEHLILKYLVFADTNKDYEFYLEY